MGSNSCVYDPLIVDTSPGGNRLDPFSPPSDFKGGGGEYLSLLRMRYRRPEYGFYFQDRVKSYKKGAKIIFDGPFASQALSILARLEEVSIKRAS
jgi:hypothetical protein